MRESMPDGAWIIYPVCVLIGLVIGRILTGPIADIGRPKRRMSNPSSPLPSDDSPESRRPIAPAVSRADDSAREPIRPGMLPSAEDPVVIRSLGKSGFGLFVYLDEGLDLQTLRRLANSNERAETIRRAFAPKAG